MTLAELMDFVEARERALTPDVTERTPLLIMQRADDGAIVLAPLMVDGGGDAIEFVARRIVAVWRPLLAVLILEAWVADVTLAHAERTDAERELVAGTRAVRDMPGRREALILIGESATGDMATRAFWIEPGPPRALAPLPTMGASSMRFQGLFPATEPHGTAYAWVETAGGGERAEMGKFFAEVAPDGDRWIVTMGGDGRAGTIRERFQTAAAARAMAAARLDWLRAEYARFVRELAAYAARPFPGAGGTP